MSDELILALYYKSPVALERYVLVTALGLFHSIWQGYITALEAEAVLFTPGVSDGLAEHQVSAEVLDLVARGFFLDDVFKLFGRDKLLDATTEMEGIALALLKARPYTEEYFGLLPRGKE